MPDVCVVSQATSRPMKSVLERLTAQGEFVLAMFGDDVILNKPIEEWPVCQCLLAWHSEGFPLKKVRAVAQAVGQ